MSSFLQILFTKQKNTNTNCDFRKAVYNPFVKKAACKMLKKFKQLTSSRLLASGLLKKIREPPGSIVQLGLKTRKWSIKSEQDTLLESSSMFSSTSI